jgi:pimeloyl-ACP methyl ester carboxylesterase
MTTRQVIISDAGSDPVELTFEDTGQGAPYMLLHGGAGPRSVRGFGDQLVTSGQGRAIVPTHPGFEGTPRPESLTTVAGLASTYGRLLDQLDLSQVTVLGNSIGGWIAAEIALNHSSRVSGLVIVDGIGIDVPEHPPADVSGLSLPEITQLSYHDPGPFLINPSDLPAEVQAVMAVNRATLAVYAGPRMVDTGLRARLAAVRVPTLVVWGDSDGIAGPEYGRAFAEAIPGAHFELLTDTGHLPQMESPDKLMSVLQDFPGARSAV